MTQGEEPPACLNGCLTASLIIVFIGFALGVLVAVVMLGAACLGAVSAQEPDDVFIRGMIEAGILPNDFEYVPLAPTPSASLPAREIKIELTHDRTSQGIDYTRVCLSANFYISVAHLALAVAGNGERADAIDNAGKAITTSNRHPNCQPGWTDLGATTEGHDLVSFDLATAAIEGLQTFDSEDKVATLWICGRQRDFFRDACSYAKKKHRRRFPI